MCARCPCTDRTMNYFQLGDWAKKSFCLSLIVSHPLFLLFVPVISKRYSPHASRSVQDLWALIPASFTLCVHAKFEKNTFAKFRFGHQGDRTPLTCNKLLSSSSTLKTWDVTRSLAGSHLTNNMATAYSQARWGGGPLGP